MASAYSAPVTAVQVGSYFVGRYYQVLQQQPDLVHQFYSDASSMIRVDGDTTDNASSIMQIHTRIMSLNFTSIEIKTINSLDSWNGGILVMISGTVKSKEFSGRRKFVQMFFLAPQEKGYFVLNDIFQFIDDGMIYQQPTPLLSENYFDPQPNNASSPHLEPPVSDYVLEEEAREYINFVHIEEDLIDKYSLPEQQQQQEFDTEVVVEETLPAEDTSVPLQGEVNNVHETSSVAVEEPIEEPPKKTYASILQVAKGQPSLSVSAQPSWSSQTTSEWNHAPQPPVQQSSIVFSAVPESGLEAAEEGFAQEGEPKSVYVRNLSPDVTEAEVEEEFKNFGQIKPDGVFIRSRMDIGVCYAFVEFEDIAGVHNALKASPIQLAGRQVYIEERRPNSSGVSRGGRRGRGRGSYPTESTRGRFGGRSLGGRGSNFVSSDYNRIRGNGFHQRGARYD